MVIQWYLQRGEVADLKERLAHMRDEGYPAPNVLLLVGNDFGAEVCSANIFGGKGKRRGALR